MKKRRLLLLSSLILAVMPACSRQIIAGQDELGCERPPGLVATTGVEIRAFTDILPGFFSGGLAVKTNPAVWDTVGFAARGNLTDEYIICRATKGGFIREKNEMDYLRKKLAFMRTTPAPSAEQYIAWEKDHPPPEAELALAPETIHFHGNPNVPITLSNFGDAPLLYWLENFPEFPLGPFFISEDQKKGTLGSRTNKTMDVVISMRNGVTLQEMYTFVFRTDIRKGQRFPVTIKVQTDQYP